jgi:hypothetical protein
MYYKAKATLYINDSVVEQEITNNTNHLKHLLKYWENKYENEIHTSIVYVLVKEL